MRDKIGTWPYDVKKVGGKTILKFYHRGPKLQNPDDPIITLTLDKDDIKKLANLG